MSLDELAELALTAAIKVGWEGDWYCRETVESDRDVSSPRWAREFTAAASPATVLRLVAIARAAELLANGLPGEGWIRHQELRGERFAALRQALEAGRASIKGEGGDV